MSSSVTVHHRSDLVPLAPARQKPIPREKSNETLISRLKRALARVRENLPSITSHKQAMLDLADGYERMAWRCEGRGRREEAARYRECARAIRLAAVSRKG